jgi:cellulose synthase/poly-beta-1,6-N-acetylglucosamine synthase-like glycosyltransferase
MKISIIIPIYKDLVSLKLILNALQKQTYKDFEIIITEDDDSLQAIEFLNNFNDLNILHLQQKDTGRNKIIAQNKAISKAKGDYLIFIDGDIVPFKHFVEYTLVLAKPKRILSGRRVNLNKTTTKLIKSNKLNIEDIEDNYFKFLWKNKNNKDVRGEQGIQLNPNRWLYKNIISKRKRNTEILGCNFSCYKDDMIAINGFDEEYHPLSTLADDTDLTWRLKGIGYELFSSKNIVNCFHLWHKKSNNNFNPQDDIILFKKNKLNKEYFCKNGLDKFYIINPQNSTS